MDVKVGLWRKLSCKELMLLNCGVGEDSWESLGLHGDPTSRSWCSLEGLMLKLKLQYFGHLMRRVDSLEKTLMLGRIGGRRRRELQRMIWLDGITNSMHMSLGELRSWWWTGRLGVLGFMGRKESYTTEQLNWTDYTITLFKFCTEDYITTIYPAWGQFLLLETLLTNPVILNCKIWDWV